MWKTTSTLTWMKQMKTVAYKLFLVVICLVSHSWARPTSLNSYGPQIRVAVAQFGATDKFVAEYGGWDIGGGLAAQLVTSLIDTNRVIVVERATLSKVLMEQELGQSKLSSAMTQVQAGQLLGVDFMIVGQVTEFEAQEMQAGAAVAVLKGIGPKFSSDIQVAHVAIDIRVIDTRTGEVIHSHRAQGKAWGEAVGMKMKTGLIDFGGEMFHKTPLGKATRRTINNAVTSILGVIEKQMKDFNWLARVIDTDANYFYIDAGKLNDVSVGTILNVTGVEKVLNDPETNEILGLVEYQIGMAEVTKVELKYAKVRMLGTGNPPVGSLVRFSDENKSKNQNKVLTTGYKIME